MKGGLWLAVARVMVNVFQIVGTVVAAWFLSPSDFGLVAIATTIAILLNSMTHMQLGEALIRHKQDGDDTVDVAFTLGLLRGLLLAAVILVLAEPVAGFYGDDRLIGIMQVLSLMPLVLGLTNPRRYLQQRELIFTYEIIITLTQKFLAMIVTLTIAFTYQTYWALVIGALSEHVFGTILSYLLIRYRPRLRFSGFGRILNFSVWLTLGAAINTFNWRVEFLLIGKFLGMAPLGIYRMGSNLAQNPTSALMTPVRQVVFAGFTSVIKDPGSLEDPQRVRNAYQRTQALTTALALPIGVGFALIADPLVRLVLDSRWYDTIYIVQYLSVVFALQTLGSLVAPLAMARDQTRLLFIRDTQMLFIRLPMIVFGLYAFALPGVVIARAISGAIGVTINMFLVRRLIGLPVLAQLRANARSLASIAIMAASVSLISAQFGMIDNRLLLAGQIACEILIGGVTYAAAMVGIWWASGKPAGPETEMIGVIHGRLRKATA